MLVGIAAILVGIAAVILTEQTKLTTTKALFGGVYIKDEYRVWLIYGGIALTVLGAMLTVVSVVRFADPSAVSTLSFITGLLLLATLVGGGVVYAAYKHAERQGPGGGGGPFGSVQPQAAPSQAPTVSTPSAPLPTQSTASTCGAIPGPGAQFTITASQVVSCQTAEQIFTDLFAGEGEKHEGASAATSYTVVDGWSCGSGAGAFGCTQSGEYIQALAQ